MATTVLPSTNLLDRVTTVTPRQVPDVIPFGSLQRVQDDSFLAVTSYNSLASLVLRVRARVLCDDGSLRYVDELHVPNSDRSPASTYHALAAGILLDISVAPETGTPRRGQCYALVAISRRWQPVPVNIEMLAKGYVTAGGALLWPHGAWCDAVEGPGWMRSASQGNPAVQTDFTITVPTGARWALRSLTAQLVTDATAQTRVPTLVIDDGTTTLFQMPYATGQTATLTYKYFWENLAYAVGLVGTNVYVPVPLPFPLLAGWRIKSSTTLLGAADQWSAIQYDVEEWIEA